MHRWAEIAASLLIYSFVPWIVLIGGYFLLLRAQARSPERFASVLAHSLIGSALLTLLCNIGMVVAIWTSTSSTASIAFLFLPMYSFAVALLSFAACGSLLTLLAKARGGSTGWKATLGAAVVLALLTSAGAIAWHRFRLLGAAASAQTPQARLSGIAEQAFAANDFEALERLAANPALDAELARRLTAHCKDELEGAQVAQCYSVFVGLAGSSAATPELLSSLAKFPNSTIRSRVALNPRTPAATAESLANDPEESVRMWIARHPELSRETLERLATDADPSVRNHASATLRRTEPERAAGDGNPQ